MSKAAATRHTILEKAFGLIYANGYQATSVDDIIATTKVTKGAFYYHFANKDEMGLAIISEIMIPLSNAAFIAPLTQSADPAKDIYSMMKHLLMDNPLLKVAYGCPAGNLTQELSQFNEAFNTALTDLIEQWSNALQQCVNNGRKTGVLRKDVNAKQVAYFVMSGYWGIRNFGKLYNNKDSYKLYLKELKSYLESLKK